MCARTFLIFGALSLSALGAHVQKGNDEALQVLPDGQVSPSDVPDDGVPPNDLPGAHLSSESEVSSEVDVPKEDEDGMAPDTGNVDPGTFTKIDNRLVLGSESALDPNLCVLETSLHLIGKVAAKNNLGTHGPGDTQDAEGILIPSVFPGLSRQMDFAVQALGRYYPDQSEKNGMIGDFVNVNVEAGGFAELQISIRDHLTNSPPEAVHLPDYVVTFVGLEQLPDRSGGYEYLTVEGFRSAILTADTNIIVGMDSANRTTFRSNETRTEEQFYDSALRLTEQQLRNSVSLVFDGNTTSFLVRFETLLGQHGRDFQFTGLTNLVCLPPAFCSSMTCPPEYVPREGAADTPCSNQTCSGDDVFVCCQAAETHEKMLCSDMKCPAGRVLHPDADNMFCAGKVCDESDMDTCCLAELDGCEQKHFMNFKSGSLVYSNIGGLGPDVTMPHGLRIRDIFPYTPDVVDLVVTNSSEYHAVKDSPNVLSDDILDLNILAGAEVSFNLKLMKTGERDKGHNVPLEKEEPYPASFFFTLSRIDGNETTGVKSVTVEPVDFHSVSKDSAVIDDEIAPHKIKFMADGSHVASTPSSLAKDFAFPPDILDTIANVYLHQRDEFTMTLHSTAGTYFRHIFTLSGLDSNMDCKQTAKCDTMVCPRSFKKSPKASWLRCAGAVCTPDDVPMCCVPGREPSCKLKHTLMLNQDYTDRVSNLGGLGPNLTAPSQGITLYDVFPNFADKVINMRVVNTSHYEASPEYTVNNSVLGSLLFVAVKVGTKVDLEIQFFENATGELLQDMFPFMLTFFNLHGSHDGLMPAVEVPDFEDYFVDTFTDIRVDGARFSAGDYTDSLEEEPQLMSGLSLTARERQDLVSIDFGENSSVVKITLDATAATSETNLTDVVFQIGGVSRVVCPAREKCALFECPEGYVPKKSDYPLFCSSESCASNDLDICCERAECTDENQLVLSQEHVRWNNLGGNGPDFGTPPSIMVDNVFPGRGGNISMNITVEGVYFPGNASLNGILDQVGNINIHTGARMHLVLYFINATTNESVTVPHFMFSVGDLDEQRDHGGHESVNVFPIPEQLYIPRALSFDVSYPNFFSSRVFGGSTDNLNTSWEDENPMQENHSVSMVIPRTDHIRLGVNISEGWKARNIHFGGSTKVACPPAAPPQWENLAGRRDQPFEADRRIIAINDEANSQNWHPLEFDPVRGDPLGRDADVNNGTWP